MAAFSPLERAILRTLAYYDVHEFPLLEEEILRWLYPDPSAEQGIGDKVKDLKVQDIAQAVDTLVSKGLTERVGEYIVLKGRGGLVQTRKERLVENKKKWTRALTMARYVEVVPFIRMVAVVNTVAINNGKPTSDVDLLIVTAPHHIWITRVAVTAIVSLLGYRRHKDKIANRMCLSFYLSTDALNIEPLKREESDPHFMFWASQAVPLLDEGIYERYMKENQWISKHLPNAFAWDWKKKIITPNSSFRTIKRTYENFFNSAIGILLEGWLRDMQMKRFAKDIESKSREPNTDVVISEDVLKFHEADRRLEYNQKFQNRLQALGL